MSNLPARLHDVNATKISAIAAGVVALIGLFTLIRKIVK